MNKLVSQYLETALWSSTNDDGSPLDDDYSVNDIAPDTILQAEFDRELLIALCAEKNIDLSQFDSDQIGHDFWLTRNGHGAGFWDGDYPIPIGDQLTEISKTFGSTDPYVGDDGLIHFF